MFCPWESSKCYTHHCYACRAEPSTFNHAQSVNALPIHHLHLPSTHSYTICARTHCALGAISHINECHSNIYRYMNVCTMHRDLRTLKRRHEMINQSINQYQSINQSINDFKCIVYRAHQDTQSHVALYKCDNKTIVNMMIH